jgi:hypothetical protein
MKKYLNLCFRIDEELDKSLRELAEKQHSSIGYLIRSLLRKSVNELNNKL